MLNRLLFEAYGYEYGTAGKSFAGGFKGSLFGIENDRFALRKSSR
jgi:hypothetical protein